MNPYRSILGTMVLVAVFYIMHTYLQTHDLDMVSASLFTALAALGGWLVDEDDFMKLVDGLKGLLGRSSN